MSDLVEHRRWQADAIEKHNPPVVGEWNWPQMLRDDADEIERLTAALERLSSPLAFTNSRVATNEETARMRFAEAALETNKEFGNG